MPVNILKTQLGFKYTLSLRKLQQPTTSKGDTKK